MRIVIDPVSVDATAARLLDLASELAAMETGLRSTPLTSMPSATAVRVSAALNDAAVTLRSLVIDYVGIAQELRLRSSAIRSDPMSWLTPDAELPVWFGRWFRQEIVKGGVAPFSAAFARDAAIGRLSHILRKYPEEILHWFTNVDAVAARTNRALDQSLHLMDNVLDPLKRANQQRRVAALRHELKALGTVRAKWLGRIRAVGRFGILYGGASHLAHSEANTYVGKGLSTAISFALTKSAAGTSLDLATGGGLGTSADFYAITAETLVDPDLGNYQSWTEANLRGDNGWLFRIAAQIPENGEYLADYTYDKWTWFPVDEETGETRFEWRPWKWDDYD